MAEATLRRLAGVLLGGSLLAIAGCVSSSDIESVQSRLGDIQKQVTDLQREGSSKQEIAALGSNLGQQMQTLLKAEADMRVELASLSSQIDELQGRLEDTSFRLSQLSQQMAATQQELRSRAPSPGESTAPPGDGAPGAQASSGAAPDPEAMYQSAYSDYLRGSYDLASLGFQQYLQAFPETDLSDNATYWIAECLYRQGKFKEAIEGYDRVFERYPRSDKLPSALLKKAYAHLELGQRQAGVTDLQRVLRQFSASDEANLARQRLRSLGVDPGSGKK